MPPKQRMRYFERVAAAMNEAAAKLQTERDQLNALLADYKAKLESMARAMRTNNSMLQQTTLKHNEDRQQMLKTIADQNTELRRLRRLVAEHGLE